MRAKVNPKPATRNGVGRVGSTDKASASTEQVEASRSRSRQRCQSVSHEVLLCRAARTRCIRSRVKRSAEMPAVRMSQRTTNAEGRDATEVSASPKPITSIRQPTHNALSSAAAVGGRLRRIVSKIPNREVQPHNRKWLILER